MGASTLARAIITNTIDQIVNRKQMAMTLDDAMETLFSDITPEMKTEIEELFSSAAIADPHNLDEPGYLMLNFKAFKELSIKFWTLFLRNQGYTIYSPKRTASSPVKKEVNV